MSRAYMEPARSTEWETPAALFADLDVAYSFDLDAAATPQNAKCARFFTATDDALIQDWNARAVWCNPPYGRELPRFIRKAWEEVEAGHAGRVVLLIPARTDTAVFHEVIFPKASRIEFLRGRVHFGGGGLPRFRRVWSCSAASRKESKRRRGRHDDEDADILPALWQDRGEGSAL